jgi:hypothetical protein
MTESDHRFDPRSIEESLVMLERYVPSDDILPLTSVLRELAEKPNDGALLARLAEAVDNLGILQGAVLTYAPVITGLLSDDPFSDDD